MTDSPNLDAAVEDAALELVQRNDLGEIESILVANGATPAQVQKLMLLIPSAFAREHYEPQGIGFPDHFFEGPKDQLRERPYASEPIYECARRLARRWIAESRLTLVLRILDWSAEAKGIRQAKERGLTPTRTSAVHHGFDT
jgi:hypothetical protein